MPPLEDMRPILHLLLAVASAVAGFDAPARERLYRHLDWRDGLPVDRVDSLAQGTEGFLWVATPGGVARFDGTVFQSVDREEVTLLPGSGVHGVFWRSRATGAVRTAVSGSAETVAGPSGGPLTDVSSGVLAGDGALWVVLPEALWRRSPTGEWAQLRETEAGETVRLLGPARDGAVFETSGHGLLRTTPGGARERLGAQTAVSVAIERASGAIVAGTETGEVLERAGTELRPALRLGAPVTALAERSGALLVAARGELVLWPDGRAPERITARAGLDAWTALLVDREGGLWCGSQRGLVHFPEPETASWSPDLPGTGRAVERGPGWVLYTAPSGTSPVTLSVSEPGGPSSGSPVRSHVPSCIDRHGRVWTVEAGAFVEWAPGLSPRRHRMPGLETMGRCAAAGDGGRWLGTNLGIVHLTAGGALGPPRLDFEAEEGSGARAIAVYETPAGELWASRESSGRLCHRREGSPWACDVAPGIGSVVDLLEMPSGELWAGTTRRGVLRRRGPGWEPVPGHDALPTRHVGALVPAGDGGAWVAGTGFVARVVERPDASEGWEIAERLGAWQGLPSVDVSGLAETDDGALWLASSASLIRVPREARRVAAAPPSVALVAVTVDGEPMELDRPLELPARWTRMSLRFAAPSYRDPGLLRYRLRLSPDAAWQAPTTEPLFRFAAMTPGEYDVEVEASLDGEVWSAAPARFSFRVPRPWYRSPWLWAAVVVLSAALLFAVSRARLALQVRMTSQRARIARDLHDHLGSGLGSIGLLARVVSRSDVEPDRRAALVDQIRSVAGELSTSLHDIVWSLKAGEANLPSLASHLVERGSALFPGERPVFEVDLPSPVPREELSLAVRRNVLLIGLEALHNAARHAGASRVRLALTPEGRRWMLRVTDDGRGHETTRDLSPSGGSGLGLGAMRARAGEIGARLTLDTPPGGGTEVRLSFAPRAEGRIRSRTDVT